jgi:hypothetical protein
MPRPIAVATPSRGSTRSSRAAAEQGRQEFAAVEGLLAGVTLSASVWAGGLLLFWLLRGA